MQASIGFNSGDATGQTVFHRHVSRPARPRCGTPLQTVLARLAREIERGAFLEIVAMPGSGHSTDAVREQLKVFQDRGIVIVVVSNDDLHTVGSGANLIQLLRQRYERVRLDLSGSREAD